MRGLSGEPPRTRTWNLEIKSLRWSVLACTRPSANSVIFQGFCRLGSMGLSTAYAPVPAWLQYGCSNFPAPKSMLKRYCSSAASSTNNSNWRPGYS
jgi:hypothetical protein